MTTTPPPPDPFAAMPAPTPPPPPELAPRRWRWAVAGATAGAVLAASVAIPLTWAARETATDSVTEPESSSRAGDGRQGFAQPWLRERPDLLPSDSNDGDASEDQATGVVLIDTVVPGGEGAGTGLVLSDDGLVLTNYHVVDGSSEITATVATTGDTYSGRVVGYDDTADVALVQLDDAAGLDEVRLDDDGDDEVGDDVTAVGNARGGGSLVTAAGTITAVDQHITTSPPDSESLDGLIRTDAAAVPGYSGGPMLDDEGEVIGVTTAASASGAGESFAVPIEDALAVVDLIEDGDEAGTVQVGPPAYLGVSVSDEQGAGVAVAGVTAGTPAADAGLTAGDRITAIAGEPVSNADELVDALGQREPGDRVEITWTSGGAEHQATVTLAESPYA